MFIFGGIAAFCVLWAGNETWDASKRNYGEVVGTVAAASVVAAVILVLLAVGVYH
jgi:hypothetical protein